MKKTTLIFLAFIAAHAVAAAAPAPGPAPELRSCAYAEVKAAVVLREVSPQAAALVLLAGCGDAVAAGYLKRMEYEGVIERAGAAWRVK